MGCAKDVEVINKVEKTNQTVCESSGGIWGYIGEREGCNHKTSDAGKICSDNSQCQGDCIADPSDTRVKKLDSDDTLYLNGTCSKSRITAGGCISFVENGKVEPAVCID